MIKKSEFFSKHAKPSTKVLNWVTKILGIVCAIVVLWGAYIVNNSSLFEIPIVETAENVSDLGEKVETVKKFLSNDKLIAKLEEYYKQYESEMTAPQKEAFSELLRQVKEFQIKPSMSNTKAVLEIGKAILEEGKYDFDLESLKSEKLDGIEGTEELEGIDTEELSSVIETIDVVEKYSSLATKIFDIVMIAIWVFAGIVAIMAILAGCLRSITLSVFVIILSIIPSVALVGIWHFAVVAAIVITMFVLIILLKTAYKKYIKALNAQMTNEQAV